MSKEFNKFLEKRLSEENVDSELATEEEIREHFQHMCNAGYDPLLCTNGLFRYLDLNKFDGSVNSFTEKTHLTFFDKVINEEIYNTMMKGVKSENLSDLILIPYENVVIKGPACLGGRAAVFWLYPSGCKTLQDLFNRNIHKIKDALHIDPKTFIVT